MLIILFARLILFTVILIGEYQIHGVKTNFDTLIKIEKESKKRIIFI